MQNRYYISVFFCLFLLPLVLQGRHIIGGDISYVCLGEGHYRFRMKIYRDCSNPTGDDFDLNAPITVFKGNAAPYVQELHIYAPLRTPISNILPDLNNPCLVLPPGVCVEEGVYSFELSLPVSNESYHIVYQRCCRNNSISNIETPGRVGATYVIELTPAAQAVCNNSPEFNDFPPVVICAGEPLSFDHSATDADGDQLVYELCSPLLGAGVTGFIEAGDPTSCDGYRPDPACPPPFSGVNFITPDYNFLVPMHGDPPLTIDPNTGLMSGTPTVMGQFVVGICIYEYRNGELLSVTRRDFQFNVADCDPTVVARVEAEEVVANQFIVRACDNPVSLVNLSFQQAYINNFFWEFDINGQSELFHDWSPSIEFPATGVYQGRLVLNPNSECGDTAKITLLLFPGVDAGFTFSYDTCFAAPVAFTDLSASGSGGLTTWAWSFGDGEFSSQSDPLHLYRIPGLFDVSLQVTDLDGCTDQITKILNYQPVPALIIIAPSRFTACAPAAVFFDNLSFPIDETYDIFWEFGDGGSSAEISPFHTFEETGLYDISIEISSPIGCTTDTVFSNLINILPAPRAGFSFSPGRPSQIMPDVAFQDESQGAIRWFWDFGSGASASEQNPLYTFPDTGLFEVKQLVTHISGCTDSSLQLIDVRPELRYFLPSAFTPNDDSVNDLYRGVGIMAGVTNFEMTIWNRWGEMIFHTTDPQNGWNGRRLNAGREAPNGIYVVLVTYQGPRGRTFEVKGLATLLR